MPSAISSASFRLYSILFGEDNRSQPTVKKFTFTELFARDSPDFEYVSKLEKKSIRETADDLMMQTIKDHVVGLIREAAHYLVELNELYRRGIDEKNARLWIVLLRKVLADRSASGT
jgi:hypothetical protein